MPGLAGFCRQVEKNVFFPLKKLGWQKYFLQAKYVCPKKIRQKVFAGKNLEKVDFAT